MAKAPAVSVEKAEKAHSATRPKRAASRLARVKKGIDALDLWMNDLIRGGLAGLESQPAAFWEDRAARLVDAQAPGLASRVRKLARIPSGDPRWPSHLLGELGRIAMLTHAFRHIEQLPAPLQADVRQLIGWSLTQEQVLASGESVSDEWIVVGQRTEDDEHLRAERTWLSGVRTKRSAVLIQFAPSALPNVFSGPVVGTAFEGELAYWPGAFPQRAVIRVTRGEARASTGRLPGFDRIDAFLDSVSDALARQPWLDRMLATLRDVTPIHLGRGAFVVRDQGGNALRLAPADPWALFARSGGRPVDLVAEWDGEMLTPIVQPAGSV